LGCRDIERLSQARFIRSFRRWFCRWFCRSHARGSPRLAEGFSSLSFNLPFFLELSCLMQEK
jgi:hypothetical protein